MDSWWFWFLGAAIFVSTLLLVVVCLNCRNKGPQAVYIRETNASEDYMPSTQFHPILHPHLPSNLHLSPPSAESGTPWIARSFTPTETESNPSYENPVDGPNYINAESDNDDPGYIIVLPEGETPQSRASTPSSDIRHDYENVPKKEEDNPGDGDYQNVQSNPSSQSDTDDDDDDEGNYVNINEETHN